MWRLMGIVLLFTGATADAADWRKLGNAADKSKVYVDIGGLQHRGNVSTFWEKWVGLDGAEQKQHLSINCSENTWSWQDSIKTNAKGAVTESRSLQPFQQNWAAIPPETVIETARDFVCPLQAEVARTVAAEQSRADKKAMDLDYVDRLIRNGDCPQARRYADAGFDPDIVSHVNARCGVK